MKLFFNRPGQPWDRAALLADMESATEFLCVASGWLSDPEIMERITTSDARIAIVIMNLSDVAREHAQRIYQALYEWAMAQDGRYRRSIVVRGGINWEEGIMHHKFVVCDDRVAWFGSMNLTSTAVRNYEMMARVTDREAIFDLSREALAIIEETSTDVGGLTPRWLYGRPSQPTSMRDIFEGMRV